MTEAIIGELGDLLWERVLARDPLTALRLGRQVESLPPGGPDAMEQDVASELLRYAVDDPGQALGYHVGHWYLRELRGTQDIREFHDAVLASGPLPLRLLQASLAAARPVGHDLP